VAWLGVRDECVATDGEVCDHAVTQLVDDTGLIGLFDFDLAFSPEGRDIGATPVVGDPPSIFTALQEQLGLKLESTRAPVEVFVIDKVERPTED
jgi:uncharacterized protein (TIGR03435 family)